MLYRYELFRGDAVRLEIWARPQLLELGTVALVFLGLLVEVTVKQGRGTHPGCGS